MCCARFHRGDTWPETAETLMRSRYTAFVKGEIAYLKKTTWPAFQARFDEAGYRARSTNSLWVGLRILEVDAGDVNDRKGTVTFEATSMVNGVFNVHREKSLFKKKGWCWYYVEMVS